MSIFEFREWFESLIPAWVVLAILMLCWIPFAVQAWRTNR